ncbi:hypothetical protein HKX48_007490 [Thoreauomyces humboldtii]|nr:hypothetical protein HKX48_007490 [Thoreauomyces humboldtii]
MDNSTNDTCSEPIADAVLTQKYTDSYNSDASLFVCDVTDVWDGINSAVALLGVRGVISAVHNTCLVMILYNRIAGPVRRLLGPRADWMCFLAVLVVFPLELTAEWWAMVKFAVDRKTDELLYLPALIYAAPAYRAFIDISFSAFSWSLIRDVSHQSYQPVNTRRLMSESNAFLLGYSARFFLFITVDIIAATAVVTDPDDSVTTFPVLTLWALLRSSRPTKPYLLLTDMARIRALSDVNRGGDKDAMQKGGDSSMAPPSSSTGRTAGGTHRVMSEVEDDDPEMLAVFHNPSCP